MNRTEHLRNDKRKIPNFPKKQFKNAAPEREQNQKTKKVHFATRPTEIPHAKCPVVKWVLQIDDTNVDKRM